MAKRSAKKYAFDPKDVTGKHLVIVESPTKAKTINKYLGNDYFVMASVGHVRDLPKSAPKGAKRKDHPVPGVDLQNNFSPTYEVMPDKKPTVTNLQKAAKQAQDVWFATDLDREGEAIAWHLAEALGVPTAQAKRVVFNAITKGDIARAFQNPRTIATNVVNAQQARRIVDRIVGYQVSPLLWRKVAGGLSAGRVQSVAVRLVVEREREIEAFIPDEFWKINALFATDLAKTGEIAGKWSSWSGEEERTLKQQNEWLSQQKCLRAELVRFGGAKFEPSDRAVALDAAQQLGFSLDEAIETEDPKGKGPAKNRVTFVGKVGDAPEYKITSIETRRTTSRPSPPFITSTMQQAAANRLGFQLQRTMRTAQQLYEGIDLKGTRGQTGLITYMRTDSTHLSGEALDMSRTFIEQNYGKDYLPEKPNFYKSSNKDAQEAHEAIRPTDATLTPAMVKSHLSDEQYKLYKLIWERFISCQMLPAQWDSTSIEIQPTGVDATLKASGRTLVFDGFYRASGVPTSDDIVLPKLNEGEQLGPMEIDPQQKFTSPPPRFTEASLQKRLEEEGIGRPSTYAAIISTIQDRKYVEPVAQRDRRLKATDIGKVVTDKLVEAFPEIMDVGYTRRMEAGLDEIETGQEEWQKLLHRFYDPFKDALEQAMENTSHAKAEFEPAPDHLKCPKCGAPTCYRFGRNGRFLGCTKFMVEPVEVQAEGHDGTYLLQKARGKARPQLLHKETSAKLGWMKLTKDDKAKFQKISDEMPERCDYAAPIDSDGNPMLPEETDVLCPEDGTPLIKRTGRFGPFLASQNYPEVKFILKLDPKKGTVVLPKTEPMVSELTCPKCEEHPLYVRDSKRGLWLSCSSFPKCRGRVGFSSLEEDQQKKIEADWAAWVEAHPLPVIKTIEGQVVEDGYEPKLHTIAPA
ncbi:type I DNA topoisomerase [Rosistilla oblonga]|uniref:type I DNA topoisomerase n=1 Tax=Rosistilla oblonga TaxID=2527990 RepID=UPI003A97379B